MADIELYADKPNLYNRLQHSRPDYAGAVDAVVEMATRELSERMNATVADFCCGTGSITKTIAEKLGGIKRAILIDINWEFLKIARASHIKAEYIGVRCSDILNVRLGNESDVVLSVFAYHHVPNDQKQKYVSQVRSALKPGGVLILAEIYMPDREATIQYYKNLYESVSLREQNPDLHKFLMQTAQSDEFEFKVSKDFADTQFRKNGFKLLESKKIWPLDSKSAQEVGTFVQTWRL